MKDMEFGDVILRVRVAQYVQKALNPALGIQLLKGHMLGVSKNDKKITTLRKKNEE